jgi:hypothetical protein
MVLKIVYRRLVHATDKTASEVKVDRFFDGFNNVVVENIDIKDDKEYVPNNTYSFLSENTGQNPYFVKKLTLIGHEPVIIWVDDTYEVYLLSDTGKTIERI